MEKFEGIVKYTNRYSFYTNYSYRGEETFVYKFESEDGKIYVWKSGNVLVLDGVDIGGEMDSSKAFPQIGAIIRIKASVKGENNYRGEDQILLTRVKVVEIIEQALSKEEKTEIKKNAQIESLNDGDFVYEMPYRQYKNHYSDCETLAGSYDNSARTIGVIIREGRLKNSGVRFQRFNTYRFRSEDGKRIQCRYAVSEENARRRVEKELPEYNWVFDGIAR